MDSTALLLIGLSALLFAARILPIRRFWLLPLRNGESHFLATAVEPGFYSGAGARLLRRYRMLLIVPLLIDAVILLALVASGKFSYVVGEQLVSFILMTIFFNLLVVNFSVKARFLSPASAAGDEQPVKSVQLSLEPRRLRDHSNFWTEAIIAASALASLLIAIRSALSTWSHPSLDETSGVASQAASHTAIFAAVWLLYLQAGMLLLKRMFVRWRMKLPMRRTDDYKRWRAAWLRYHMRVFDAVRVFFALVVVDLTVANFLLSLGMVDLQLPAVRLPIYAALAIGLIVYCSRELRRLRVVEKEIRPVELVKEFPRPRVAEGRFLAGGLLYFNRDNPVLLARSAQGVAINLAHPGTYVLIAYLAGLILLASWQFTT
jgi:hypothetical protein